MRRKIQPSKRISKEISELLEDGYQGGGELLDVLIRKSTMKLMQEILEQEVKEYLGLDYYERNRESFNGYRNGYEKRKLKTAEGRIDIEVPQLRNTEEPYSSSLLEQLGRKSAEFERLITEMYVRGLSTRDIEDTLIDRDGRPLISKSGVSEVTDALSEEYERFSNRDLSGFDVVYMFVDGVYESLRQEAGFKEGDISSLGYSIK